MLYFAYSVISEAGCPAIIGRNLDSRPTDYGNDELIDSHLTDYRHDDVGRSARMTVSWHPLSVVVGNGLCHPRDFFGGDPDWCHALVCIHGFPPNRQGSDMKALKNFSGPIVIEWPFPVFQPESNPCIPDRRSQRLVCR